MTTSVQQQETAGPGTTSVQQQVGGKRQDPISCCSTLVVSKGNHAPCCSTLVVPSRRIEWTAVGNPFLLDAPLVVSVRISTATPPDVLAGLVAKLGAKADRGVVLASPWISPGEKAVKAEALARGGRIVQLLAEGMGKYYKPSGGDFDACSEGRMLQLSPFAPQPGGGERRSHGKARFEWLNRAARAMGDLAAGISRAQLAEMAAGARSGRLQRQGGEI